MASPRESVFQYDGMCALVRDPSVSPAQGASPKTVVLYLHGWAQSGSAVDIEGLQRIKDADNDGLLATPHAFLDSATVLAPQCPPRQWWDVHAVHRMLAAFLDERFSDLDVSLTLVGVSMGGYAAWTMLQHFGAEFARAVIVCGGDDPYQSPLIACALRAMGVRAARLDARQLVAQARLPTIYIVHGEWDPLVPITSALRCAAVARQRTTVTLVRVPLRHNASGCGHHAWKACRKAEWWGDVCQPPVVGEHRDTKVHSSATLPSKETA